MEIFGRTSVPSCRRTEEPSRPLACNELRAIKISAPPSIHEATCHVVLLRCYFSQQWMDMCAIPASRFGYRPSLPQAYNLPTMQANVLKVTLLSEGATSIGVAPEYVLVSTVQQWIYAKSSKKRRLLSSLKPQVAARTDLLIKKFTKKKKLRKTRLLYCIHAYII